MEKRHDNNIEISVHNYVISVYLIRYFFNFSSKESSLLDPGQGLLHLSSTPVLAH